MNRIPASATTSAPRRRLRRTGKLNALTVSIAVVLGLVAAPIIERVDGESRRTPLHGITLVAGSFTSGSGLGDTTLSVTTHNVGDVVVVTAEPGANAPALTSVTGGGVATWHSGIAAVGTTEPRDVEIWYGTVSSVGTANVTFAGRVQSPR